jgi:hypothetical protein
MALQRIPAGLLTMAEVWAYSVPVGLAALLFPFLRRSGGSSGPAAEESMRRGLAVFGTWVAALLVFALNGIDNPRYTYPAMPLLALVAAAAAVAWHNGRAPAWTARAVRWTVVAFAPFVAVVHIGLAVKLWHFEPVRLPLASSATLCILAAIVWMRKTWLRPSLRSLAYAVPLFVALYVPVASYKLEKCQRRSSVRGALQVRRRVPPGDGYTVGYIHNKPEFFLYADRHVELLGRGAIERDLAGGSDKADAAWLSEPQWMVLREEELQALESAFPGRITHTESLDVPRYQWHLVRYSPSEADARASP